MLTDGRQTEIREIARRVQNQLWHRRAEFFREPPASAEEMLPIPVHDAITKLMGLSFEQPDHIPVDPVDKTQVGHVETAGLIDRQRRTIMVGLNFPYHQRRYTAAHELGHWMLHKDLILHRHRIMRRDRPLSGPDRSPRRPMVEQEADLFAAEFLMPRRLLQAQFLQRFSRPIDRNHLDEEVAFAVKPVGQSYSRFDDLHSLSAVKFALLIGTATHYRGQNFDALTQLFRVSPIAMAIQLVDHQLVI